MLKVILGGIGKDGLRKNFFLGERVFINYNAVMLDCAKIIIGNDVLTDPVLRRETRRG